MLPVSSCEAERRTFQFAPETEKVPAQYDGTEQINSVAVLHVLLGLAIFCAMYLCYVYCIWTLYLPCIVFYLQDCAFVTFIY